MATPASKVNPAIMSLIAAILFLLTAIIYLCLYLWKHEVVHIGLFSLYVSLTAVFIMYSRKQAAKQPADKKE
jgi:ABC-type bacteriocin/lantibiotic exporter with double-glycine peptidase domain